MIKGLRYLATEIDSERLKINGFYSDWTMPTFHIIRFLLYAFMIVMIYPYLPGADSGAFQGISVFVGLIISLGSSTVKLGDRIKLNETTGNVVKKNGFRNPNPYIEIGKNIRTNHSFGSNHRL